MYYMFKKESKQFKLQYFENAMLLTTDIYFTKTLTCIIKLSKNILLLLTLLLTADIAIKMY